MPADCKGIVDEYDTTVQRVQAHMCTASCVYYSYCEHTQCITLSEAHSCKSVGGLITSGVLLSSVNAHGQEMSIGNTDHYIMTHVAPTTMGVVSCASD
jgi:hypothetical protein